MKEQFLSEFKDIVTDIPARHFVLAVSGGVDSVVLAWLFNDLGVSFELAHCNFKLRGNESDRDEIFVSSLASKLGVEFQVKSFNTAEFAKENGVSTQMAARSLRYAWFDELIEKDGSYLVTAHHSNDNAETVLFNLAKGTGLAGLHGIRKFDGRTIRPLLWASKDEIEQFAQENNLIWHEDASNVENKYSRNRIRNKIIPEFEKINPAFVEAVKRTAERIADSEELIDGVIEHYDLLRSEGQYQFINKQKLISLPGRSTILYRLINQYGYNYDQVDMILNSSDSIGATFISGSTILNVDRKELVISLSNASILEESIIQKEDKQVVWGDKKLSLRVIDSKDYALSSGLNVAGLDMNKLKFPLSIRVYKEGEKFQPLGMNGRKLVSDYLIDKKVPLLVKKKQAVLVSDNTIAWLVGQRIDDRYKITKATTKVFEITLETS